jgi:ATP-dependent RNA helicase MSS116
MQIADEAKIVTAQFPSIKIGISIGGTSINKEREMISGGLDILVATPGRLLDHLGYNADILSRVETFVLDECDRLLDMGFKPDITKITTYLAKDRQTILCSATTSDQINIIIKQMLKSNHATVCTVEKGDVNTHKRVPQVVVQSSFSDQLKTTITLLQREASKDKLFKAVVFLPTAHLANLYYGVYEQDRSIKSLVQHSRQSQKKREQTSNEFKNCLRGVLFATDVVARGMDFPNVSHVFQVGVPDSTETYIHRIGRTGRADNSGKGFIILDKAEMFFHKWLMNMALPISVQVVEYSEKSLELQEKGVKEFTKDDSSNPTKVYQSWLGYYKGRLRDLKYSPAKLVEEANWFAESCMGCEETPGLLKKTVGKMGLKGVPGLRLLKG